MTDRAELPDEGNRGYADRRPLAELASSLLAGSMGRWPYRLEVPTRAGTAPVLLAVKLRARASNHEHRVAKGRPARP